MTPEDILRLSEYLEALYIDTHSALVLILAKHLKSGKKLTVEDWQSEKLSELTQVIQQCAQVIAQGNAQKEQAIQSTLRDAVGLELTPVDDLLSDAVDAGKAVQPISGTWAESARVSEVIRAKAQEMAKKTRLVNASMLQSAQQAYTRTVQKVANKALVKAIAEAGLESIMTGEKSYTTAVSQAIHRLVNRGIYGFMDARGREWSPEAYINMLTRTTIHSAAIDAQRERTAEYGVTTFQIGPNKISRPLCAPYVGWICSWDGSSGIIHDLDGNAYQYVPITDTSYGDPAGIFGINCGHSPYTFVDGFSLPRSHEMTPEELEKNEKAYLLTQKQRAFERDVRSAKLESAALKAAGLDGAEMAQTAEALAKNYEAWCRENNLTPRAQRLQVFVADKQLLWYNKNRELLEKPIPEEQRTALRITGARIVNPDSKEAAAHAERYYGLLRKRTSDVPIIAKNTGYSEKQIQQIKNYLFIDKHDLGNPEPERFAPDFAIAQSWQRLIEGQPVQHDWTLLKHEVYERELVKQGIPQGEAHKIAQDKYNYKEECLAFYAALEKHQNNKRLR